MRRDRITRRKHPVICLDWHDLTDERNPRFWQAVAVERHRRRVRKNDLQCMRLVIETVRQRKGEIW